MLCDRYADSTIAYQGYGRGMDADRLQAFNDYATGGLWPERTLLLDLPVEQGLQRARARNGREGLSRSEGRFEAEELAFHERIREGFLARTLARTLPRARCAADAGGASQAGPEGSGP